MRHLSKSVIAVVSAVAITQVASAADLPRKAPAYVPPPPVYSWTGFYIGGHVGYGWSSSSDVVLNPLPSPAGFFPVTTLSPNLNGWLAGAQAGYNWQFTNWVVGIETDFSWTDIDGSATLSPATTAVPGSVLSASQDIKWFGTTRLRAGYAWDRTLLYVTGGAAYARVDYAGDSDFRPQFNNHYPAAFSKTKLGWTAGAGVEQAFGGTWGNWSVKGEYLYYDLGSESAVANSIPPNPPFQVQYDFETKGHLVRIGLNYKFN